MPAPSSWNTPDAVAARQHFEGGAVVEIDGLGVEQDAAPLEQLLGLGDDGEGLEAEKVELHQPGLFRVLIIELGHRHVGARIAVKRQDLVQRPVADHHAGRMGGGVAVKALDLAR